MSRDAYTEEYLTTNETLEAVMAGLEVSRNDTLLTIAGSGDQAFAFLEQAKKVNVIDMQQESIERIRTRRDALRQGDVDEFLDIELERNAYVGIRKRNKYFRQAGRIERIRKNLDGLEILGVGDIIQEAQQHKDTNKMYVSNAIDCFGYCTPEQISQALRGISQALPVGGLLYVAGHEPQWESLTPPNMPLDEYLTRQAEEKEEEEFWSPRVFRKIE